MHGCPDMDADASCHIKLRALMEWHGVCAGQAQGSCCSWLHQLRHCRHLRPQRRSARLDDVGVQFSAVGSSTSIMQCFLVG